MTHTITISMPIHITITMDDCFLALQWLRTDQCYVGLAGLATDVASLPGCLMQSEVPTTIIVIIIAIIIVLVIGILVVKW